MFRFCLITCILIKSVFSLRVEDADEGSCQGLPTQPVEIRDPRFMDKLTYVPAASRFHYYTIASAHPRFSQMRESDLINNMCKTHNFPLSKPESQGSVFGFGGRNLGNFTARQIGRLVGAHRFRKTPDPTDPQQQLARLIESTETPTLTDYKTFAFCVMCWTTGSTHHKGWLVLSSTPQLSSSTKRMIENHAASLGFNRKDFLFLNPSGCYRRTS